ncbi:MAG: glycosyltransferase [Arachnia sp.]
MVIGYYVHHHGAGHLTRARVIASSLRSRGAEVVLMGSDLRGAEGVALPRDNDGSIPFKDPDASAALHWAPLGHPGFSARMAAIAAWVKARKPQVVVVDVSVEVVALLRLLGIPTVVVAQPGDRTDDAHTLAYRCATAILAPWPEDADPCPALRAFAHKVTHTGGISGLQERERTPQVGVVLTGGAHESDGSQSLANQLPHMRWVEAGGQNWVDDVGALLARAHVVVSHAGQNAIADIAAIDVPAVVCPRPRPHSEQVHLGAELDRLGYASVAYPEQGPPLDWVALVHDAMQRPSQWSRWGTASAPTRAAELIERIAHV